MTRCHLCGARLTPGTRVRQWGVWTCLDGLSCGMRQWGEKPEKAVAKKAFKISAFAREMLRKFDTPVWYSVRRQQSGSCAALARKGLMERKLKATYWLYRTTAAGREALAGSEGK